MPKRNSSPVSIAQEFPGDGKMLLQEAKSVQLAAALPRKWALKEMQVCFRIMELCVTWKYLLAPLPNLSYFLSCIKTMDVFLLGEENQLVQHQ